MIATDGASGLRAAHACKPDLLLLDIGLPDCRGDELLQQMRALPGWTTVPAVAVTADHAFELAGTSFDALWTKPLHMQQTLERLDLCLAET
jgi:DNA-binding response OmpR family regulator